MFSPVKDPIMYSWTWNSVFSILWAEMAKSGTNENFLKFAQVSYFWSCVLFLFSMGKPNTKFKFSLLTNLCYKIDFMDVILCRLWVYPSWTAPVINVGHCFKHGLMFDMKKQKFYFLHFCMPYSKVTLKIRKVRARVWVLSSVHFKVQLFWEGHKNLRNLSYGFDVY